MQGAANRKPTIIYIVGKGHSGSTLLDLLISSHSAITSVGELKSLSQRTKNKVQDYLRQPCTCGAEQLHDCPFWHKVDQELYRTVSLTLEQIDVYHNDLTQRAVHNQAIIKAVQAATDSKFILDSSKNVERLAWLLTCGLFDVRPIHLLRNPLGAVNSQIKKGRSLVYHVRQHTYATMYARRLLKDVPHYFVRYEDLATSPQQTVGGIMNWLDLPFEPSRLNWTQFVHHNVGGNPIRFVRQREIRLDTSWRTELSIHQKLLIHLMTLPTRFPGNKVHDLCLPLWGGEDKKYAA